MLGRIAMSKRFNLVLWILLILGLISVVASVFSGNGISSLASGLGGGLIATSVTLLSKHFLAERDYRQQLRMTSIEQRLATHQEAFSIWRRMASSIYDQQKLSEVASLGQDWWDKNSLYLEPSARKAFQDAIIASEILPAYRDAFITHKDRSYEEPFKEQVGIIKQAGKEIERAVRLPPIETEIKRPENDD
jgi:hypothetical protein